MADILEFRANRPDHYRHGEGQPWTFLDYNGDVGPILLMTFCARGFEETGPYHVILRTPDKPDHLLVTLRHDEGGDLSTYLPWVRGYVAMVLDTLRFAGANTRWLPSHLPPVGEPA